MLKSAIANQTLYVVPFVYNTTKTHGSAYTKSKKKKKTCGKVLTKGDGGDIMYKLSAGKPEASGKKSKRFLKKVSKKY